MTNRTITTLTELRDIAREVFSQCKKEQSATVIGLSGDLGSGKTAFVKELAKLLKIEHEITSPTFVIMKSYAIPEHSTCVEPLIFDGVQGAREACDQTVVKSTVRGANERSNEEIHKNQWFYKTLVHIDAYRIESDDEMRVLKFSELLKDTSLLICIEWPEKIEKCMPLNTKTITFMLNSDGTRDIQYNNLNECK